MDPLNLKDNIENQVERFLNVYLDDVYRSLASKLTVIKDREILYVDDNEYYCLGFFSNEKLNFNLNLVSLDLGFFSINKTKDQPKLCSLYELLYTKKGVRASSKKSLIIGYLLLITKKRLYKATKDTILLQEDYNSSLAVKVSTSLVKDINDKIENTEKQIKEKQIIELIPGLYSFFNKEKTQEFLGFSKTMKS